MRDSLLCASRRLQPWAILVKGSSDSHALCLWSHKGLLLKAAVLPCLTPDSLHEYSLLWALKETPFLTWGAEVLSCLLL